MIEQTRLETCRTSHMYRERLEQGFVSPGFSSNSWGGPLFWWRHAASISPLLSLSATYMQAMSTCGWPDMPYSRARLIGGTFGSSCLARGIVFDPGRLLFAGATAYRFVRISWSSSLMCACPGLSSSLPSRLTSSPPGCVNACWIFTHYSDLVKFGSSHLATSLCLLCKVTPPLLEVLTRK